MSNLSLGKQYELLYYTPQLQHLIMKELNPSFILPEHIRSVTLTKIDESIFVNTIFEMFSSVENLQIDMKSKYKIFDLIDRL
ncbi:unnamed protein product [Rotaria sp. Silwood2]|nr:unnamed protein product [Rotaria sp. Silwood2]CAF2693476.1 unnamed protein product [Rotaria sp. Silwood2]CAF2938823.1 unnamed protein product [Rotaria sp. Silwood2]CAF3088312.1 unnamed protein product [Rotaria sp. Silwood2]CAF4460976.1 unnamed protein product [Rotaria sp. Silwood2]